MDSLQRTSDTSFLAVVSVVSVVSEGDPNAVTPAPRSSSSVQPAFKLMPEDDGLVLLYSVSPSVFGSPRREDGDCWPFVGAFADGAASSMIVYDVIVLGSSGDDLFGVLPRGGKAAMDWLRHTSHSQSLLVVSEDDANVQWHRSSWAPKESAPLFKLVSEDDKLAVPYSTSKPPSARSTGDVDVQHDNEGCLPFVEAL
jgi:hypothetical protein